MKTKTRIINLWIWVFVTAFSHCQKKSEGNLLPLLALANSSAYPIESSGSDNSNSFNSDSGNSSGSSGSGGGSITFTPASGILDTTFDSDGIAITDISSNSDDIAYAMAIQSDGKIIVGGFTWYSGGIDFAMTRYNSNGSLDTTFNPFDSDGKVTTNISGNSIDQIYAITSQSDGKIVTAGSMDPDGNGSTYDNDFVLVRYNNDGVLDSYFGKNNCGKVRTDIISNSNDIAYAMAIQSDGKIILAGSMDPDGLGSTLNDFVLVRYNTNTTLDSSFGTNGKVRTDIISNSNDIPQAMVIQSDGKIVVAGKVGINNYDFVVVRYNSDGTLDTSFGGGDGFVTQDINNSGSTDEARAIALQPDGKIVVAGFSINNSNYNHDFVVIRYNSNGTLDTSFGGGDGIVITDINNSGSEDEAYAIALQPDGKIVVAGYTDPDGWAGGGLPSDFVIVRYNSDGSLDSSFGTNGITITDISGNSEEVIYAIAIQPDGKIVAAGYTDPNGWSAAGYDPNFVVVRYK